MKFRVNRRAGLLAVACALAASFTLLAPFTGVHAQQRGGATVAIDGDDIGGVVASVAPPLCCAWTPVNGANKVNEAARAHATANEPALRLTRNFIGSSAADVQRISFPLRTV